MDEMDEGVFPTAEDVNEAAKAYNRHMKAWTAIFQKPYSIEERMMELDEIVKSLENPLIMLLQGRHREYRHQGLTRRS